MGGIDNSFPHWIEHQLAGNDEIRLDMDPLKAKLDPAAPKSLFTNAEEWRILQEVNEPIQEAGIR